MLPCLCVCWIAVPCAARSHCNKLLCVASVISNLEVTAQWRLISVTGHLYIMWKAPGFNSSAKTFQIWPIIGQAHILNVFLRHSGFVSVFYLHLMDVSTLSLSWLTVFCCVFSCNIVSVHLTVPSFPVQEAFVGSFYLNTASSWH